jgi:hypothetical protein
MPIIWMGFSLASSPGVDKWKDDPATLKRYVGGVAGAGGGELIELYYEVGRDRASALISGLDNYVNIRTVMKVLGADEVTKFLGPDDASTGLGQESAYNEAGDTAAEGAGS